MCITVILRLWLHGLGRGYDSEAVVSRQLPKSVGCSKNFLGRESLYTRARVEEWTRALAEELAERLQEDMDMVNRGECWSTWYGREEWRSGVEVMKDVLERKWRQCWDNGQVVVVGRPMVMNLEGFWWTW